MKNFFIFGVLAFFLSLVPHVWAGSVTMLYEHWDAYYDVDNDIQYPAESDYTFYQGRQYHYGRLGVCTWDG